LRPCTKAEAEKFAPVDGDPKVSPGGAVSHVVAARASPDGRYYYYEYRVENSLYPLHFWGVSAVGPGQVGSARKLARRVGPSRIRKNKSFNTFATLS